MPFYKNKTFPTGVKGLRTIAASINQSINVYFIKYNISGGLLPLQIATANQGRARRTQENDKYKLLRHYNDFKVENEMTSTFKLLRH